MSPYRYALRSLTSGKFIALDSASGGYPYEVSTIWRAQFFETADEAIHYTAVMSYSDYDRPEYDLFRVEVQAFAMEMPKGEALRSTR